GNRVAPGPFAHAGYCLADCRIFFLQIRTTIRIMASASTRKTQTSPISKMDPLPNRHLSGGLKSSAGERAELPVSHYRDCRCVHARERTKSRSAFRGTTKRMLVVVHGVGDPAPHANAQLLRDMLKQIGYQSPVKELFWNELVSKPETETLSWYVPQL